MATTKVPGWLAGLRSALAEVGRREAQPGRANTRIISDWIASYQAMLAKVPEDSLIEAYRSVDQERSIREAAVLFAEVERRGLDV